MENIPVSEDLNNAPIYSNQQMGFQQADFYKWGLNIEDVIDNLEHNLRGQFWNRRGRTWETRGIILMNEKGVNFIATLIRSRLGRHIAMSDLEDEDIRRIALEVCENIADVLEDKWRVFGVELCYMETIVDIVDHVVFTTLRRAFEGGERAFIKEIAPDERRVVNDSGQDRPSLVPFFDGGNKQ